MTSSAKLLRDRGAADLKGRWAEAALLTFVYQLICGFCNGIFRGIGLFVPHFEIIALFVFILIIFPMSWGLKVAFLENHRKSNNDPFGVECLFRGYRDYSRITGTLLLVFIYTLLWLLLLIVPGIIKAFSYSMTNYILLDRPDLKYNAAIELSMDMMRGHKWDCFWLGLTFIGWAILCIFTLGIGFFWLIPYMNSTMANFYEEVKAEYESKGNYSQSC